MSDSIDRNDGATPSKTWQQKYGFVLAIVIFLLLVGLMIVVEKSN